jgi:hypothetical protein
VIYGGVVKRPSPPVIADRPVIVCRSRSFYA